MQTRSSCSVLDAAVLHEATRIQDRKVLTGTTSGLPVTPKTVSVAVVLSVCGSCTVSDLSDLFSLNVEVSVCKAESRRTKGAQRACPLLGAGESSSWIF